VIASKNKAFRKFELVFAKSVLMAAKKSQEGEKVNYLKNKKNCRKYIKLELHIPLQFCF